MEQYVITISRQFGSVFQAAAVQHFDYGRASVVIAHCPEFLYNSP